MKNQNDVPLLVDNELRLEDPECFGNLRRISKAHSHEGKHVAIKVVSIDGSYYKYKGFNSVILLAFEDTNNKFIIVDVGCSYSLYRARRGGK